MSNSVAEYRRAGKSLLVGIAIACSACFSGGGYSDSDYRTALELVDRGTVLLRNRAVDEADALFALSHELVPLASALDGRGCVAVVRGHLDEAESFFLRAYDSDRTYDDALANLALVKELKGDWSTARELYRALLSVRPEHAAARHNLAALEHDEAVRSGTWTARKRSRTRAEITKAIAMGAHGVMIDNLERLNEEQGL
jgi:tetratricopeptide (TPR) repeat protein